MTKINEPRHSDFEKIYQQFQARYCTGDSDETSPKGGPCRKGDSVYYAWLNTMGLDDTKPYGEQVKPRREQFSWAEPTIHFLKAEEGKRLYKVEALMPLTSMNDNIYTEDELLRAARTLKGKVPDLNHTDHFLDGCLVEDAEYEDGAVETIVSAKEDAVCPVCPGKYKIVDMLDHIKEVPAESHIYHVSIEATCRSTEPTDQGNLCQGLVFTGIALLTKDVLPGVPLTRIMPVEAYAKKIVESYNPAKKEYNKAPEDTAWDFDGSKYDLDQLRHACAVVTGPSGADGTYTKDDCHLPHHLPGDGKTHGGTLVWRGIAAAGAALQGGRGGVKLSDADAEKARNHLTPHYHEFDKKAPWEEERGPAYTGTTPTDYCPEKFGLRREVATKIEKHKVILELYAGTGEITREVYAKLGAEKLVLVEEEADLLAKAAAGLDNAEPFAMENMKWMDEHLAKYQGQITLVDFDPFGSPAERIQKFFSIYKVDALLVVNVTDGCACAHFPQGNVDWKEQGEKYLATRPVDPKGGKEQLEWLVDGLFEGLGEKNGFTAERLRGLWGGSGGNKEMIWYVGYMIKPKRQESKPNVLTREGFWTRFRELRSEGVSRSDAYRIVSMEVLETLTNKGK